MFKLYDNQMNEIPFPDGVKPLDIFISSINKERITEKLEGSDVLINYGSSFNEREIKLEMLLKAYDTQDYRLLRDAVYAMFQTSDTLYVVEEYEPGKRYHIAVDESFIPERIQNNQRYANATINCSMVGIPFAESIGTTMDIDSPDYAPKNNLLPIFEKSEWENGWINKFGSLLNHEQRVRMSNFQEVDSSKRYIATVEKGKNLYLREYDNNKQFIQVDKSIKVDNGETKEINFNRQTKYFKIYFNSYEPISPSDVGTILNASLYMIDDEPYGISADSELWQFGMGLRSVNETYKYTHVADQDRRFLIYNAGNVPIHPFEQFLEIEITDVEGSTLSFELRNETNGTVFKLKEMVEPEQVIKIEGANVTIDNLSALRKTDRRFIQLSTGENIFTIQGARKARVKFNFRYYFY